jgi:hypothetical protein
MKGSTMSISLSDLPAAVAEYITNHVSVRVGEVKHGTSSVLRPHEKGTSDLEVTTQATLGEAIISCTLHARVDPASVFPVVPAGSATRRRLTVS